MDMEKRFLDLASGIGVPDPQRCWFGLYMMYTDPDRHYHNLDHIQFCLGEFDKVPSGAGPSLSNVFELAIWYHDVVYNPLGSHNEISSAIRAIIDLRDVLPQDDLDWLYRLIMATRHQSSLSYFEERLICDIDLASLGGSQDQFRLHTNQIRKEYAAVEDRAFWEGRHRILSAFLNRRHIYYLPYFRDRYEKPARQNIQFSLEDIETRLREIE